MHVTIIDGDIPYPPTSGKRLRTLNLLLPLASRHSITYIGRSESADTAEASTYLSDHGLRPILVHSPLSERRGARFALGLAKNLLSPLPYNVQAHQGPAMREAVQAHARKAPVDVWQVEWLAYEACLNVGQGPVVLQAHNVDALIWQRYYETERRPAHKLYIAEQLRKLRAYEGRIFARADKIVAVSQADADLARALYGPLPLEVVDNGVDIAHFAGVCRPEASTSVLFLGALDWRPNLDAIDQLLSQIWPALRSKCPQARLDIVGRNPPASLVQRVAATQGVTLHANVPDVRPFLSAAAVMAVPLRIGGGSRLKILEALASGLPVVSTAVGAEGLNLIPDTHLRLAETPDAFAAALAQAIEQPQAEAKLAARGRAYVAQAHDWSYLASRLEAIWLSAAEAARAGKRSAQPSLTPVHPVTQAARISP